MGFDDFDTKDSQAVKMLIIHELEMLLKRFEDLSTLTIVFPVSKDALLILLLLSSKLRRYYHF